MAIIKPFSSLRPKPELAYKVASFPYDVLNSKEARTVANGNPYSFLHITKSEIDLPEDINIYSDTVYKKAEENLQRFIRDGILFVDEKPCYYIYQLVMQEHNQTGLVCLSSVQDYLDDVIKKHEYTRPEKEKDRIDHMRNIKGQTGNVFIAYRDVMEINALISGWKTTQKPVYDFTADDGIKHTIWVIDRDLVINSVTELFRTKVPCTYIADGHHRAASAARVSQQLPQSEEAKFFLTTVFPAGQLRILDYNRLVKDLNDLTAEKFLGLLQDDFYVTLSPEPVKPSQQHEFGMFLEGKWYILTSRKGTWTDDPVGVLDVSILSNNILNKILDIKDQRTDKRIDFVGGIRGLKELEKRVNSGEMKVAFCLYPVAIDQLLTIADNGKVMPPKSTWFEPKLRDGLLTHLI
ncbi:MAG TPA: DUF1015 family protein [Chitinophagaceae bacterium]|nr:DUF1015 family protein [Chitinophagaceae bacterium]